MPIQIDHVVFAGSRLGTLRAQFEARGLPSVEGGVHAGGETHNALVSFQDGSYLELITPTPQHNAADHAWANFMQTDAGICAWAIRSADVEADAKRYKARGVLVGDPVLGGRRRTDDVRLEWYTVKLGDEPLGSVLPFLIQDITARNLRVPSVQDSRQNVAGVESVVFGIMDENDPLAERLMRTFDAKLIHDRDGLRLENQPIRFDTTPGKHGLRDMRLRNR